MALESTPPSRSHISDSDAVADMVRAVHVVKRLSESQSSKIASLEREVDLLNGELADARRSLSQIQNGMDARAVELREALASVHIERNLRRVAEGALLAERLRIADREHQLEQKEAEVERDRQLALNLSRAIDAIHDSAKRNLVSPSSERSSGTHPTRASATTLSVERARDNDARKRSRPYAELEDPDLAELREKLPAAGTADEPARKRSRIEDISPVDSSQIRPLDMVTQAHQEPITRPTAKTVVYGAPMGPDLTEQTSPARLQEWFRNLLMSVSESTSSLSQNIRKISTPDHSEVKKEVDDTAFDDDENLFGECLSPAPSEQRAPSGQPSRSSSEIEPDPQSTRPSVCPECGHGKFTAAHMSTMHLLSCVVKFQNKDKKMIEKRVPRRIDDLMFHCERTCGQKFYTEQAIQEHLNRAQYHEETLWSVRNEERLTKSSQIRS